jgi:antitoxin ParD1/3/4
LSLVDIGRPLAYIANAPREMPMPTRNVVLTDSQTDLIDRLIADGRYQNASEALRAGLRLLEREEAEMTALRDRLAAGLEEARSGVLSEGSGEDAIRRAFAAARTAS